MGLFSGLFKPGKKQEAIREKLDNGAVVIDVRTPAEFKSGHVKGSKNFPLQNIANTAPEIKKMNKPVILCCASGMRSGQADKTLKAKGVDCQNAGSWQNVNKILAR